MSAGGIVTENGSNANGDSARIERLRGSVSKLRSRSGKTRPERWLMIIGGGGVVVGLLAIILGWVGASRTPYIFEQLPYLISGGLLGLAFAVVGGLFYFGYWVTQQIQETRRQGEETGEALRQIRDLLASGAVSAAGAKTTTTGNGSYVATEKGTMFHRPDCVVVAGRSDLRTVDPEADGFEPCRVCDPLAVSS
ncbi:MAG: hypothetical protein ACRDKG_16715 [Actinomycetota bacterium]